ncbi:MAG: DUF87 domain-containing protein [Acidobacteria bacterium]|nr:DUF87 domain-containing protein [Acidobacteriota bacterium]
MTDGKFYLGKEFSPESKTLTDKDYFYKADNLTTHGVIFGMTGSGKTGLCIDLLEEAIAEDIPLIIIDPKGDLVNLALMFPEFSPQDFLPWVSETEAAKENLSQDEFAKKTADKWQLGLKSWGIDKTQVAALKEKAEVRVFTPGSAMGMKISILEGFKKPDGDFDSDEEGMVDKIRSSVSALLALLGVDDDPLKSKPHILISNIIEHYWRLGRSVPIEDLIINIQKPPIQKLGVFSIDQLMEEKERIELSFKLNNLIASPSFRFWSSGMPLSAAELMKKNGKIPVNIFYIAHLSDNERMFFVTLLLNEIVYWMRKQPGSGSLKHLFYMDEIFGYLPAYPMNPPSKVPLLTLLKQARAFGLGVILATQNPKDIDYKGLTNMGTWFIGKLQAEGDRDRVIEGLIGASSLGGETPDATRLNNMITSLEPRKFLVKNVHTTGLTVFQSRWAMSFLAGPITREQIKSMLEKQGKLKPGLTVETKKAEMSTAVPNTGSGNKPYLVPYMPENQAALEPLFDHRTGAAQGHYSPYFYLDGEVIFDDQPLGLYIRKPFHAAAPLAAIIDWKKEYIGDTPVEYDKTTMENIEGYEPLDVKVDYTLVKRFLSTFKEFLFANHSLSLFVNKELNLVSQENETREVFNQRCRDVVEKMIDREVEKIKNSYETKIRRIEDKIAIDAWTFVGSAQAPCDG